MMPPWRAKAQVSQVYKTGHKSWLPSGIRLHNYGKIHHFIAGKIHVNPLFPWVIFNFTTEYLGLEFQPCWWHLLTLLGWHYWDGPHIPSSSHRYKPEKWDFKMDRIRIDRRHPTWKYCPWKILAPVWYTDVYCLLWATFIENGCFERGETSMNQPTSEILRHQGRSSN